MNTKHNKSKTIKNNINAYTKYIKPNKPTNQHKKNTNNKQKHKHHTQKHHIQKNNKTQK